MPNKPLHITIIGLSLSSSWGNGHATTYRSLIKGLKEEGHQVTFLEREKDWYSSHRDFDSSPDCRLVFYTSIQELKEKYSNEIIQADLVIVGSFTPDGVPIGEWVTKAAKGITAFYDIDTPITLSKLKENDFEYINPELIPAYDIYLSFTGGPTLDVLEDEYQSPTARALYCSVDTDLYLPESKPEKWQLGYLGTYSDDRQPSLQRFLIDVANKLEESTFVVAGPQYPENIEWPENVKRIDHLPPGEHCNFYTSQRFTLNITRKAMIEAGFAPSVRLFEAAACGVPIISDYWEGLDTIFQPDEEILIARSTEDVIGYLQNIPEESRIDMGEKARQRILKEHSHIQRAKQLADYTYEMMKIESAW
ncbi:MAG: glycosyltransferase [Balneolaceae bacterium]